MDRRKAGRLFWNERGLLKTDLFRSRRMRRMRDSVKFSEKLTRNFAFPSSLFEFEK